MAPNVQTNGAALHSKDVTVDLEIGCRSPVPEVVKNSKSFVPKESVLCDASRHCCDSLDDDGRPQRQGALWRASALVIASTLGSGIMALPWAIAQLGWVAGPFLLMILAGLSIYTSQMLSDSYRYMDPISGKRLYTYTDAVNAYLAGTNSSTHVLPALGMLFYIPPGHNLRSLAYRLCAGRKSQLLCSTALYSNFVGVCIAYAVTASNSMKALRRSDCLHSTAESDTGCSSMSSNIYIGMFGIVQIFTSQIRNFHEIWWLSISAVTMSVIYSSIAIGFGISISAGNKYKHGSVTGTPVGRKQGDINDMTKAFAIMNAFGSMAFAYNLNPLIFNIQDTLKRPPAESTTMKKAIAIGITMVTFIYGLMGFSGYAAFGNDTPGSFLSGISGFRPTWLVDVGNMCIVFQLACSYQIFAQPIFAAIENWASQSWPGSKALNVDHYFRLPVLGRFSFNFFRLSWRTTFVCFATFVAMLIPFFNAVVGFLGALCLWPLVVHLPAQIHKKRTSVAPWTVKWCALEFLSWITLIVSLCAGTGAVHNIIQSSRSLRVFS